MPLRPQFAALAIPAGSGATGAIDSRVLNELNPNRAAGQVVPAHNGRAT